MIEVIVKHISAPHKLSTTITIQQQNQVPHIVINFFTIDHCHSNDHLFLMLQKKFLHWMKKELDS